MRSTTALYKRLLADRRHTQEVKVDIAGVEYGQGRLVTCSTSGGEFDAMTTGNCAARKIELSVRPLGRVPRMAEIKVYMRLSLGAETSEWMPNGIFYVDTRETDKDTGLLTLYGFDAMMKSAAVWLDPTIDAGEWPMSQRAAVEDISRRMGVRVDPRTSIAPSYKVEYPNDYTMQEILGFIAAANCGNWIMTGDGKLLLVPLGGIPMETNFLVDSRDGGAILMGDVRLIV